MYMKIPTPTRSINQSNAVNRISFDGSGGALLWLALKSVVLSVLSFGLYSFWAKVSIRKYLWSGVRVGRDSFSYHGTGGELLWGAVIYLGIALAAIVTLGVLQKVFGISEVMLMPMLYLGSALAFPYAGYLSQSFLLHRTEFRGVRFGMVNDAKNYAVLYFSQLFLTVITLGLYYPAFRNAIYTFKTNRMFYGDKRFIYTADHKPLKGVFFACWLLFLPTLGLSMFWYKARESSYQFSHTRVGELRLVRDLRPLDVMGHELVFWAGLVFTLGLAAPWLVAWRFGFYVGRNAIVGEVPAAGNVIVSNKPSGVVESLAEAVGA